MYSLPNGLKIDHDGLIDGINDTVVSHKYYFDTLTGQVGLVKESKNKGKSKKLNEKRYFLVPKILKSDKKIWADELIKEMVWREDSLLASSLNRELNKEGRGFDAFFKILKQSDYIYGWCEWESHYLYERMLDWFDTLPVEIKEDFDDLDDDCPLCQLMKNGNHSIEDFKMATKKMPKNKVIFNNENMKQDKRTLYYDALDLLDNGKEGAKQALKLLVEALEIDPDFVQTYIGLVSVYGMLGKNTETRKCIKQAFEKTKKLFPKWPKSMSWGDLDNRAYMRAIQYMGDDLTDSGDKDGAIELYKLLLKMNPNDNQGVRYTLAGLYAGISGSEVNEMFDEGNNKHDWSKLEKLVDTQNKKYLFWKKTK
ncbi:MAG: hypothetical protein NTZ42_03920 [Candidatus Gribaldobacteria bacterium]|nr:hypothetical protein [Candidatus Gribaldobacteria bacterium]